MAKRKSAQADAAGAAAGVVAPTSSHLPAGANAQPAAAQPAAAGKPRDSSRQSVGHAAELLDGTAATTDDPVAPNASPQKHKKRRKGSKPPATDAAAQQQAPAQQPVHDETTASGAAGEVARDATDGGAAGGSAMRDPLSPEALQAHSAFFDRLVELVPARHYHDLDADRVSTKYMKKADRDAAKAAFRKQHKQNRKDKLDPDKAHTALDVQRQLAAQAAQQRKGAGDQVAGGDAAPAAAAAAGDAPGGSTSGLRLNLTDLASREELQQRLAAKVAALRAARHAEERRKQTEAAKRFRATNGHVEKKVGAKRKRGPQAEGGKGVGSPKTSHLSAADFQKQLAEVDQALSSGQKPAAKRPRPAAAASPPADLSFGRLDISKTASQLGELNPRKKRRKESKAALLAKAEAKQQGSAAGAGDAAAEAKAAGEAWNAALARARGEKVLDDPTRLRRSLKKESKAAAKRGAAWAERTSQQQQSQAERQKRRTDNLQARVTAKADKKKAKREKKLLRPGFEGRRSGFIPSPGGGSGGGS